MPRVERVAFERVKPLGNLAKREGVTMADPPGAVWLAALDGDDGDRLCVRGDQHPHWQCPIQV